MDVKDFLQLMSKDDIISVMQKVYNASYKLGKDDTIMFESVCHNSESKKLYYYHNPRTNDENDIGRNFYCYVCGTSGNIIDILGEMSGLDFNSSISVIENATGLKIERGRRKAKEVR